MELSPRQQATEILKTSQKILILTAASDGDSLGACVALLIILKRMGKSVTAVSAEPVMPAYSFLPAISEIKSDFTGAREFIIDIDTTNTPLDKLSYRTEQGKLRLVITPQSGTLSPENISFSQGSFKFDLICILDTAGLEQFGSLYDNNAELFYATPILNIDHHASNEQFGKINLIEMTATSTCEILVSVAESLGGGQNLIDEDIATALLTGLIYDTSSFQNTNTTPKSFTVAAQLVAAGARQQEIVKHLYKTKPVSTLRLWGRILAGIREDAQFHFVWSVVSMRDYEQCQAKPYQVAGAVDELLTSAPDADIILLLSEQDDGIHGSIRTTKGVDAVAVANLFGGGGHPGAAGFILRDLSLAQAEKQILERIRKFQSQRLGISSESKTSGSTWLPSGEIHPK